MSNNSEPNSEQQTAANDNLFVVGIGASAGGLSALQELFSNLSSNSGAAFVVIQHLSPDFKSLMKELLERRTTMPVHRVLQGMELKPNSVYLIPPGQNLALEKNILHLEDRRKDNNQKHELNFPIDLFLISLAKNYGEQSIGVILSGSGSDGTRGLKAINEAGGVALVQEPKTAEFDGMPLSAIATGVVNQILPPRELSQLIYQCVTAPAIALDIDSSKNHYIDSSNLNSIAKLLLDQEGLDFSQYKSSTISRRIHRRCLIHSTENIDKYIELLHESETERQILCSDLLINVTHFFRDYPAWQNLENNILPRLIEQSKPDAELRFWITACSTGEEAYSLAILVHEALQDLSKNIRVKIFATDVDRVALEKASQGVYPASIATDIGQERLQRYFIATDNSYQVMRKIREMLIFSPHDLTKDAGFTRINLVTCRNVLIYMKPDLQYQVLRNLHFALVSKGILFLGEAETLGTFDSEFEPLDKKWKFFQKQRDIRLPLPLRSTPRIGKGFSSQFSQAQQRIQLEPVLEQCLNRLCDSSDSVILTIGKDYNLIHVSGDSSKIFKPLGGKITTQVTTMVVQPLQLPLNTGLHRARQQEKSVLYQGIRIEDQGEMLDLSLEVIPPQKDRQHGDFFVVKIQHKNATEPITIPEAEKFELGSEASRRIMELENELQQTRENLQALVEELETTNEEQQASNEELTASNEELQSTNEELHSVNEELHTVNIEYQSKISELTQLSDDVDNLLQSTEIGVVFLDRELKIRKFTPAVTEAIALRHTDLDRPLEDLHWKFDCPDLLVLLREVLDSKQPQELEVVLKQSKRYLLMQIHLYQTESLDGEGLVLSFIRIDEIKQTQLKLEREIIARQRSEEQLKINQQQLIVTQERVENIFDSLEDAIWSFDLPDKRLGYLNPSFEQIYGRTKDEFFANNNIWLEVIHPQEKDIVEQAHQSLQKEKLDLEYRILRPDGSIRWVRDRSKTIYDDRGNPIRQDFVITDLTPQKQAQQALKDREQSFQAIFNSMFQFIGVLDLEGNLLEANRTALDFGGLTPEDVLNKPFWEAKWWTISEATQEQVKKAIATAAGGEFVRYEVDVIGAEDRVITIDFSLNPVKDEAGQVVRLIPEGRDISEVKQAREELRQNNLILEQRVAERTQSLKRSSDRLEQANQAKDNFIAHMSHELRTPLNSIIGFSHILKKDSDLTPKQLKSINIVNQSGQHLLALINDILDLSRLNAHKLKLKSGELNLATFLHNIATIFDLRAQDKGLEFVIDLSDNIPTLVNADETRLRQVLFNLLSNAIKFTDTGTVNLSVTSLTVAPLSNSQVKIVRFAVDDTGQGIPEHEYDTIFAPFGQLEQNGNGKDESGTGLGLPISQKILNLMDSKLHIESKVGRGSRFWFDVELEKVSSSTLPVKTDFKRKLIRTLATPCKVLVVDDHSDNRKLLVEYLQALGFSLEEARDGREGVALALEFQPDLILLDLMMPVMDGKEMLAIINQNNQFQNTIVLLVSANIQSIRNSSDLQCDGFLAKPVDLSKLLESIDKRLDLEWKVEKSTTTEKLNSTLIMPPETELSELRKLAKFGDISAIEARTEYLRSLDERYIPFIQQVLDLVMSCQKSELERLLAKCTE